MFKCCLFLSGLEVALRILVTPLCYLRIRRLEAIPYHPTSEAGHYLPS